jgi:hypothetical protein
MQRLINDAIEHQRRIDDCDPERVDVLCISLRYAAKLVMEQMQALHVYQGYDEAPDPWDITPFIQGLAEAHRNILNTAWLLLQQYSFELDKRERD